MATTTTAAEAFSTHFARVRLVDAVFRNDEFFKRFPLAHANAAGSHKWRLKSTGNDSGESFEEGGAFSSAGNNTYAKPEIAKAREQATFSVTEDLVQDLAINESRLFDAEGEEARAALVELFDTVMARMLGSTASTDGWQLAVDSTGTYAGLVHNTQAGWDSSENNLGGAMTIAAFQNARETLRNVERDGKPNVIYLAPNQITNYNNLVGAGASTSLARWVLTPGQAGSPNVGDSLTPMFDDIPLVEIKDMTNTIFIMTETQNWEIVYWDTPAYRETPASTRGLLTQSVPKAGHKWDVNVAFYGSLVHYDPFRSHKETGITA